MNVLEILLDDREFVAVLKPSQLLTHKSEWNPREANCMFILRDQIQQWVYPVHRLDRATSGVLLFAKNPDSARTLAAQFFERKVKKTYACIVRGWTDESGKILIPLCEEKGRPRVDAETHYQTLYRAEVPIPVTPHLCARYSWIQCVPRTGRMHQIRKHLHHISHPIVGDVNYGSGVHNRLWREHFGIQRLMLFATELQFTHPTSGAPIHVRAPGPEEILPVSPLLQWRSLSHPFYGAISNS